MDPAGFEPRITLRFAQCTRGEPALFMDPGRIELPLLQCECSVLPLNYRPKYSNMAWGQKCGVPSAIAYGRGCQLNYRPHLTNFNLSIYQLIYGVFLMAFHNMAKTEPKTYPTAKVTKTRRIAVPALKVTI